ncbi:MAG: tRNA pseudouridine(54/55) synthase Pus10 [Candidatus Micrarchaeota archaeon]
MGYKRGYHEKEQDRACNTYSGRLPDKEWSVFHTAPGHHFMKLCKFCNSSKGGSFKQGKCEICEDKLLQLDKLAEKAAMALPEISTFSLSTGMPSKWLAQEEMAWDETLGNTVSLKTFVNQYLNRKISELGGKKPRNDGDVQLSVDLASGAIAFKYNDMFVFGRYLKLASGISQSRWSCSKCRGNGCAECNNSGKFYHSLEEEIGEPLRAATKAKDYTLHASGREDIDVTNAAGRPFVMQLVEAQARKPDLAAVAKKIKAGGKVEVKNLQLAKRGDVELVSASHFDKAYVATVEFEHALSKEELKRVLSLHGKMIDQQTPARVQHRRADINRSRKLLSLKLIKMKDNAGEFEISAEAGTYIKELITGDNNRTKPSFASILGMQVKCTGLRVARIEDEFLDSYFKK